MIDIKIDNTVNIFCIKCEKYKDKNNFYPSKLNKRHYVCKECCNIITKHYQNLHREKLNELSKKRVKERYKNDKNFREKLLNNSKKQRASGYHKLRYLANKIGNMDNIEKICLEHDLSPDVANAIAMDGIILDKEMKKRGII